MWREFYTELACEEKEILDKISLDELQAEISMRDTANKRDSKAKKTHSKAWIL